jgi:hypothetical protein
LSPSFSDHGRRGFASKVLHYIHLTDGIKAPLGEVFVRNLPWRSILITMIALKSI